MAKQQGGYRAPSKPAPVSGPGRMSKRTDGTPQGSKPIPDAAYGEQKDFMGIQKGAPMAGSAKAMPKITPLGAPTQRPEEPVTSGAPSGPGGGLEQLGVGQKSMLEDFTALRAYLPLMQMYADSEASSGTMRAFVRYLKGVSAQ